MDNIGTAIVFVSPDLLHFDRENPRMVEFTDLRDEEDILNALWDSMAVSEIVMSILANGFFQNEPLYVIPDSNRVGDYIVIEGNRRLAAIRAILYPTLVKSGGMKKFSARITSSLISHINAGIPVVIMQNRADSWRLIGFKHVNGAAKWDSYAKAEYIAQIHNIYGVSLEDIAEQIGDSNRTTIKLYQALMVLNQAEKCTSFRKTDIYKSRLYFSYLFSALGYSSVQDYLCIASPLDSDNPVPESNYHELEELMMWLFGSRSNDIKPIITSYITIYPTTFPSSSSFSISFPVSSCGRRSKSIK